MEFIPCKCQVVRATTAKKVLNSVYTLNGQILKVVTSARYLGLTSPGAYLGKLGYIRRHIMTKNQKVRETA